MAKKFLILSGFALLLACNHTDNEEERVIPLDELEQTEGRQKQLSRPSSGAFAPLYLGRVNCEVGELSKNIVEFKSGYNDMTITDEGVTIRITDMDGQSILIVLRGENVASSAKGSYKSALGNLNESNTAVVNFVSNDLNVNWKEGEFIVTELNPKTGKFVATLEGKGVPARDLDSEPVYVFNFSIDMRFENVMNHAIQFKGK